MREEIMEKRRLAEEEARNVRENAFKDMPPGSRRGGANRVVADR